MPRDRRAANSTDGRSGYRAAHHSAVYYRCRCLHAGSRDDSALLLIRALVDCCNTLILRVDFPDAEGRSIITSLFNGSNDHPRILPGATHMPWEAPMILYR